MKTIWIIAFYNLIIILFFSQCDNVRTYGRVTQFRKTYECDSSVITVVDFRRAGYFYQFNYQNRELFVVSGFTANIDKGDQYVVLFDKKKPENNYRILFDRPIEPLGYDEIGGLADIIYCINDKDFTSIKYRYKINGKIKEELRFLNVNLFYQFKELERKNMNLIIKIFIIDDKYSFRIKSFIDIERSLKQLSESRYFYELD